MDLIIDGACADRGCVPRLLKFIIPLCYVGIIRARSVGKKVIVEFTLLRSLDVQKNKKKGGFVLVFGYKFKID
jgi:hypothetical protein